MTVAEIKAKLPEAEVYELLPDARYIIVLDREKISQESVQSILSLMQDLRGIFLRINDPEGAIRILEMKDGE
jgi:hypothetical protein